MFIAIPIAERIVSMFLKSIISMIYSVLDIFSIDVLLMH